MSDYYPIWLTDESVALDYKQKLYNSYDEYFNEKDSKIRQEKLKELKVYLTIVSDVIAYRYLVKYYSNLFHKLHITVEEYMDYKVDRMFLTIKDKKERIEDILSYVYMSFMLSSPRLIYDYAEKIGRCSLVKDNLPYFKVQRLKFFFIDRENTIEHIVCNISVVDINSTEKSIRSDMEKYSLANYNYKQSIEASNSEYDILCEYLQNMTSFKYVKSRDYILDIFKNWKESIEDDFIYVKQISEVKSNFTLIDYIRYKYENKQTDLTYDEFVDALSILNNIMRKEVK